MLGFLGIGFSEALPRSAPRHAPPWLTRIAARWQHADTPNCSCRTLSRPGLRFLCGRPAPLPLFVFGNAIQTSLQRLLEPSGFFGCLATQFLGCLEFFLRGFKLSLSGLKPGFSGTRVLLGHGSGLVRAKGFSGQDMQF